MTNKDGGDPQVFTLINVKYNNTFIMMNLSQSQMLTFLNNSNCEKSRQSCNYLLHGERWLSKRGRDEITSCVVRQFTST